jgi:alpha-N-acetylglucosaminidase
VNTGDVFELDNGSQRGSVQWCVARVAWRLASGVYWYLKYYCNASVSWGEEGSGDNVAFLDRADAPLPAVRDAPVRRASAVPLRYYMNVCTNSYSMAFWNWARWEREIDWMALNGINFPLSFTAAEYINRELFLELGVARRDLDAFFSGPAFLAWHRMGNLRAWAGPLTDEWIDGQAALQRQILARQRELGMVSVLPGFAGFVPEALKWRSIPTRASSRAISGGTHRTRRSAATTCCGPRSRCGRRSACASTSCWSRSLAPTTCTIATCSTK